MRTATTLPLFGHAPPGERSDSARRDLREHEEIILGWGQRHGYGIWLTISRDPLGEWWFSTSWGISAAPENGTVGMHSPLSDIGPSREEAITKAVRRLVDQLPAHTGTAGRQVAELRKQLAPLARMVMA
jgi:hypothetical protein